MKTLSAKVVGIYPTKSGTEAVVQYVRPRDLEPIFAIIRDRRRELASMGQRYIDLNSEDKAEWALQIQKPESLILVAEVNKKVAGYIGLAPNPKGEEPGTTWVYALMVLAAQRRQGIGRALLESALSEAKHNRGLSSVMLCVAEPNFAKNLYESCGFVQVGEPFQGEWAGRPARRFIMVKHFREDQA